MDPCPEPAPPDEAALIQAIAAAWGEWGQRPDLQDDCAVPPGPVALLSTDTLVEGVHFDAALDTPTQIGAQAAVANLSDLAASGGAAGWLLWSLCLPPAWQDVARVQALARGFAAVASAAGARLLGGNLTRTAGPLVISVTVGGGLAGDRAWHRAAARPGDAVYVSGPLGDAALGWRDTSERAARHASWRPHLAEAAALAAWGHVRAALDVSDGLLLDVDRLARASGVGVDLDAASVPLGPACAARGERTLALTGGEDYVLLFTADAAAPPPPAFARRIGRCTEAPGLRVDGRPARAAGWDHFGAGPC
ncbi:MAG: thiamine-phosphate kinase [Myxococcales bacterium]|nr:thiamine-phosphate kinase [Myxococcales bacterium]